MSPAELNLRLRAAEAVIRETGHAARHYFADRGSLAVDRKGLQDLVSEADRACEDLIVSRLAEAFPGDSFLGEERGTRNPGSDAIWVIDPIDGTQNFLTGVPFWCVSLALVVQGEAELGLIYHPATDELFVAARGAGAFLNGAPIRTTGAREITEARVALGFNYRPPVEDHVGALRAVLAAGGGYCRLGSAALSLAYVAAGRLDGFWQRHTNSWDVGAGLVLVREAGGWTSDFLAGEGLMQGNELLACAPGLAERLADLTGYAARSAGTAQQRR